MVDITPRRKDGSPLADGYRRTDGHERLHPALLPGYRHLVPVRTAAVGEMRQYGGTHGPPRPPAPGDDYDGTLDYVYVSAAGSPVRHPQPGDIVVFGWPRRAGGGLVCVADVPAAWNPAHREALPSDLLRHPGITFGGIVDGEAPFPPTRNIVLTTAGRCGTTWLVAADHEDGPRLPRGGDWVEIAAPEQAEVWHTRPLAPHVGGGGWAAARAPDACASSGPSDGSGDVLDGVAAHMALRRRLIGVALAGAGVDRRGRPLAFLTDVTPPA